MSAFANIVFHRVAHGATSIAIENKTCPQIVRINLTVLRHHVDGQIATSQNVDLQIVHYLLYNAPILT
jgi:hypothetical protein